MAKHLFYKTGLDITNDKQMFNFLKEHYTYDTMNSWNCLKSIANKVKLYDLQLDGDWTIAYNFLTNDEYDTINGMIEDWEYDHEGYEVYFNGRSGGYLVLTNKHNNSNILPDFIIDCEDYEDYKKWCKEYQDSVKNNRTDLVEYVRLVQDFDKLCDDLRDYVNELSLGDFKASLIENAVDNFNMDYEDDLDTLHIEPLEVIDRYKIGVKNISHLKVLVEALCDCMNEADNYGFTIKSDENYLWLEER